MTGQCLLDEDTDCAQVEKDVTLCEKPCPEVFHIRTNPFHHYTMNNIKHKICSNEIFFTAREKLLKRLFKPHNYEEKVY